MIPRPIEEREAPVLTGWGPFLLERSRNGHGWNLTIGRRVRWSSRRATTRDWPGAYQGTDEHCNRAVTIHAWPVGSLTVWWEPHWRTEPCPECLATRDVPAGSCCAEHRRLHEPAPISCPGPGCGNPITYRWDDDTADWHLNAHQAAHGPEYGCTRACMVRAALANDRAARRGTR